MAKPWAYARSTNIWPIVMPEFHKVPEFYKTLEAAGVDTVQPLADALSALKYNEAGLVPAIAQDEQTGEVLMLAWMNRTAIDETLRQGRVTYYSRSRSELWRKGDTSGHIQRLKKMRIDCDGDALLLSVVQEGPACHTHRESCFYLEVDTANTQIIVCSAPVDTDGNS